VGFPVAEDIGCSKPFDTRSAVMESIENSQRQLAAYTIAVLWKLCL